VISPEEFDELARTIVGGTEEKLIADINDRLVSSLLRDGQLTAKNWRDIDHLAQANHTALQQLLLENRTRISNETKDAILAALTLSAANDLLPLRSLYGSVATPATTKLFKRVSAQTVEGVQSIIARQNIKYVADVERLWYEVAGEAVSSWNHSIETQDQIIRRAVRRLSEGGLQFVEYKSGVRTSIDAATRRHIISQAGQASGRITMAYMEEFGHDLVMTSAHFGARPEHEVWQGKAFSLSGRKVIGGVTYPDFYRATEYGDVAGLLGVNCRHSYGPYYPGITELPKVPKKIDGLTSEEHYKMVQKQRSMEREIRNKKRDIYNAEKAGVDPTQFRLELGHQQSRLKSHVDRYNLPREPLREKAYGIGVQPRALKVDPRPRELKVADIVVKNGVFSSDGKSIPGQLTVELRQKGYPELAALVDGAVITKVRIFAGPQVRSNLRVKQHLADNYEGTADYWTHVKGETVLNLKSEAFDAELHWFQEPDVGIVELYVKKWKRK
jgi:hypothetical protein